MLNSFSGTFAFGRRPASISLPLWTPAELTNVSRWFDASDPTTVVLSGSNVTQWSDISGNNLHITQSDPARQPVYTTSALNGKNAVTNSAATFLSTMPVGPQTTSCAVVFCKWTTQENDYSSILGDNIINFNTFQWIGAPSAAPDPTPLFWDGAASADLINGVIRVNGESVGPNTFRFLAPTIYSFVPLSTVFVGTVGADRSNAFGDRGFIGDYYEILLFHPAPAAEELEKIEGYLAWKWGVEANLDTTHPYKSSPPTL